MPGPDVLGRRGLTPLLVSLAALPDTKLSRSCETSKESWSAGNGSRSSWAGTLPRVSAPLSTGITASEPAARLTYGAGPVHSAVHGPGCADSAAAQLASCPGSSPDAQRPVLRRGCRGCPADSRPPPAPDQGPGHRARRRSRGGERRALRTRGASGDDPGVVGAGRSAPAGPGLSWFAGSRRAVGSDAMSCGVSAFPLTGR